MSENQDHHNQAGFIAFLGSLAFVFVFFFYIVFVNKGVTLDEKVSDPVPAGAVKFDLTSVKEPWVSTPEVVTAGQKIFKANCAVCHGEKGDLVGGIANARNLVEGQWKMGAGEIAHFKVLQNGLPGTQMASFKAQLKANERWAVVNFINSITKNKSTDKPEDVAAFAKTAE
ncbi:MAG: cytochrome c [Bdellovibrio sp.]|nr:cytochrome c [Bdellovibrio sp.]